MSKRLCTERNGMKWNEERRDERSEEKKNERDAAETDIAVVCICVYVYYREVTVTDIAISK